MGNLQNSLIKLLGEVTRHQQYLASLQAPPVNGTSPVSEHTSPVLIHPLPHDHIPKPTSITSELLDIGLSLSTAQRISDAYIRTANQLHAACESSLSKVLQKVSEAGFQTPNEVKTWRNIYTRQLRAWSDNAVNRARDAVMSLARESVVTSRDSRQLNKRPAFNHEYTPLLEKYFEHNAYPSAADRAVLARKCMMTPRQIEVWFQNHRNRAKKDGKMLRKLTEVPLPSELSLKSLQDDMSFFIIPVTQRRTNKKPKTAMEDVLEDESMHASMTPSAPLDPIPDCLTVNPPSHAFPTIYTAPTTNPLINTSKSYTFLPPVWYRKPAVSFPTLKYPIDMDEFVMDFSQKLHLRASAIGNNRTRALQPWYATRVTIPCTAPHPALLQSIDSPVTSPRSSIVPEFISRPQTTQAISSSGFTTPASSESSLDIPMRRKVVRLPRRDPSNRSIGHCCTDSAVSDSSSTSSRSSSLNSRTSSFSSDTPPSSNPTTPILSPTRLPKIARKPCISVLGHSFDSPDDLDYDGKRLNLPIINYR